MAVPKTVRRLTRRQSELRRDQLRREQLIRDQHRTAQRRKTDFRRECAEGAKGTLLILGILGFFALVYWLAISNLVPAAY